MKKDKAPDDDAQRGMKMRHKNTRESQMGRRTRKTFDDAMSQSMYSRARKKNFSKGIEGVDDVDDSLDSDMTDIEINLDEFGVEGGVEIEYGEGNLEAAAVEEHTTAQKEFEDLMKSQ